MAAVSATRGWAALLRYGEHERELSGRWRETTNNRMELRAAIEALEHLCRRIPGQTHMVIDYRQDAGYGQPTPR